MEDPVGNLPVEIAQEIFKYLGATDLSNCCRVNRQWRSYANNALLWRHICEKRGIICENGYYIEDGALEPMVGWAHAYMDSVKRRYENWRKDVKSITTVNCFETGVASDSDTLVFTNASRLVFVYDMSRSRPFCIQTIKPECTDRDILSLETTRDHLVVRQGDSFAIYAKTDRRYYLKGHLLRMDDSYVGTQHYYDCGDEGTGPIRYCIIDQGICIMLGHSLFVCSLANRIEVRKIEVYNRTVLLHDHLRAYVVTGEKMVTGFDCQLNYEDFGIPAQNMISFRSNKDITVGLISANNSYCFVVWYVRYGLKPKTFPTHRPFGFELHPRANILASVALDKFNQRTLLTVYLIEYGVQYEIDLDDTSIAQAKLYFVGKDLLYCATRSDWSIYDYEYVMDLKTMKVLYDSEMAPTNIISVDSKHAIYNHGDTVEVHSYI
uniref:Putative E3 ubiquitin ligase complex SCF subunit sconB n=1 Tax=Lygus hesperus TaxID=30085 RepID=A0A0A9XN64_LYGHE